MKLRVLAVLTLAMLCGMAHSQPAAAGLVSIQPDEAHSKDTFTYQFLNTFNFNTPPFGAILSAGNTNGGGHDTKALVQFDLSQFSTTTQISSAVLRLYAVSTSAAGFGLSPDNSHQATYNVMPITSTWDAATVTYGTPLTTGVVAGTSTQTDIEQWLAFDVTALVQSWINQTTSNFGVMVSQTNSMLDEALHKYYVGVFDSAAVAGFGPKLEITPVPEPTSIVLAMSGAAALGYLGWRRATRKARRA